PSTTALSTLSLHDALPIYAFLDLLGLDFIEDRGVGDTGADVVADEDDDGREPESDPPAPGLELSIAQRRIEREEHSRGEQIAQGYAGLRERCPETALLVRRMLGHEQNGTAPFAADGESLDDAQQHEQDRCQGPDRRIGRQAAHEESRDTDEDDRDLQQLLAPVLVAEVTEDDSADRTRDEADRIGGEAG